MSNIHQGGASKGDMLAANCHTLTNPHSSYDPFKAVSASVLIACCRSPQLASAVNFLTDLLADVSEDGITSPGGIPVDMQLQTPSESNPDGSYNNSCLVESDTIYQVRTTAGN